VDDFEGAGLQVDFGSPQAEKLAATEAEAEGQDVERAERFVVGGGEDGTGLWDGQAAVDLVLGRRDLDELGDVAGHDFLPDTGEQLKIDDPHR
jgi:hypothetical protein